MMTAKELGIPEKWHAALLLVLDKLERGELRHVEAEAMCLIPDGEWFNMSWWSNAHYASDYHCGTVACIGGWAEAMGKFRFEGDISTSLEDEYPALEQLFYPPGNDMTNHYMHITAHQAVRAIRNYLHRGRADWEVILA
jgi:hypothetical protein